MKSLITIIPPRYRFSATNLKHQLTKFRQFHYSQNGEDIILMSLFPKNYRGFYVDVGAHHPYRISNTYLLHKNGWTGINIDANPLTIKLFEKARPKDTNILCGVGKEIGFGTYHQFADPAVNTFSEAEAEHWKKKTWNKYLGSTQVAIKPLGTILHEHLDPNKKKIDVLSIDIEGFDLIALESNDWEQYRPRIVVVEDHNFQFSNPTASTIYNFLLSKGYSLSEKVKFSLVFTDSHAEKN